MAKNTGAPIIDNNIPTMVLSITPAHAPPNAGVNISTIRGCHQSNIVNAQIRKTQKLIWPTFPINLRVSSTVDELPLKFFAAIKSTKENIPNADIDNNVPIMLIIFNNVKILTQSLPLISLSFFSLS